MAQTPPVVVDSGHTNETSVCHLIVAMLFRQVEVASHISLNGMKLPPLDTGILWIRAKGCPNSYVFPPEPCDPGQSGWFIHAVNSNCTYCGDNNEFGIDTTGPCIACTPPNRDAYATTPFFVR